MTFETTSKIRFLNSNEVKRMKPNKIPELRELVDYYYWKNFIEIENKIYYCKNKSKVLLLNELVCEAIARYFKLPSVRSEIATFESKESVDLSDLSFVLLTPNFFEPTWDYTTLDSFPLIRYPQKNGMSNIEALHTFVRPDNNEQIELSQEVLLSLKEDIKRLIVVDFLTKQVDRHLSNFYFGYKEDIVKLMIVFDFEKSFSNGSVLARDYFNTRLSDEEAINYVRNDLVFQELFAKALDLDFSKILEEISNLYGLSLNNDEIERYASTLRLKKEYIHSRKLLI